MTLEHFIWAVVCSVFILAPLWFVWDHWKNGDGEVDEEEDETWKSIK